MPNYPGELDPAMSVMLNLKNDWTLTGDLTGSKTIDDPNGVKFSTGWYSSTIKNFVQVSITPQSHKCTILDINNNTHLEDIYLNANVWVRAPSDSGKSFGQAKNARYNMCEEIDRIIHVYSKNFTGSAFCSKESWRYIDELESRPIILRATAMIHLWVFKRLT